MRVSKFRCALYIAAMSCFQEVIIEGQDKVFKDVIEPLESVSVNIFPTGKKDIREFGPPEQVFPYNF